MRYFIVLILLCFAFPAAAQESENPYAITVKKKDGTVQSIDLRKPEVPEAPAPQVIETAPLPSAKKSVEKPEAPKVKATVKKPKAPVRAAIKAPPAPPSIPRPPPLAVQRAIQNSAPAGAVDAAEIDVDTALQIALDAAPPARNFKIKRRDYAGKPVYVFTFLTDSGTQKDILVDAVSGKIITSVDKGALPATRPGHLPAVPR